MKTSTAAGFTLLEVMTAAGVLSVLVGISVLALGGMKKRGNFASATGELMANLQRTRSEAYGRGSATVFIVDTVGSRWWSLEDVNGTFVPATSLAAFDPASPAPAGFNLLGSNTFPGGVTFSGASAGYAAALPAPFAGVPSYSGSSPAPAYNYCSFCVTSGANAGFGAVRFEASGGATFSGGPAGVGQSFSLAGKLDTGVNVMTVAIIARTGASESFQVYR